MSGQISRNVLDAFTTISISRRNHHILLRLGQKGQTFDEIVTELVRNQGEKIQGLRPKFSHQATTHVCETAAKTSNTETSDGGPSHK